MAARLQRYEELLHRHGIKLDELDDPGISGTSDVASTKIEGVNPSYRPGIAGKDGIPLYAPKYVPLSSLQVPSIIARNSRMRMSTDPDAAQ